MEAVPCLLVLTFIAARSIFRSVKILDIERAAVVLCLPFSINEARPLRFRQIQDIDTVGAVNGHAASSCDKAHDLIARDRIAAFGEANCHIVDTAHDDAALALSNRQNFLSGCRLEHLLVGDLFFMLLFVRLNQLVEDLALF